MELTLQRSSSVRRRGFASFRLVRVWENVTNHLTHYVGRNVFASGRVLVEGRGGWKEDATVGGTYRRRSYF